MRNLSLRLILGGLALASAQVLTAEVTISVLANSGTGKFTLPGGASLPEGSTYSYGVLDLPSFNSLDLTPGGADLSLSSLMGVFDSYGTFSFSATGEISQGGQPLSGGSAGETLSALIYTPDEMFAGIFSSENGLWNYPADPGAATLSNTLINVAYFGTLAGFELESLSSTVVPEPSTYALFVGLGVIGVAAWRRRQRKVQA